MFTFGVERLVATTAYLTSRLGLLDAYELLMNRVVASRAAILIYHHFQDASKYPCGEMSTFRVHIILPLAALSADSNVP